MPRTLLIALGLCAFVVAVIAAHHQPPHPGHRTVVVRAHAARVPHVVDFPLGRLRHKPIIRIRLLYHHRSHNLGPTAVRAAAVRGRLTMLRRRRHGLRLAVDISTFARADGTGRTTPCVPSNDACWRPFGRKSPYNRPIPANPKLTPRSASIVARTLGFGSIQPLEPMSGNDDPGGNPVYFGQPGDPTFRIHCTEHWGRCKAEGRRIHIPAGAMPEGPSDAHLTVIEWDTGWVYDLWAVSASRVPRHGGRLSIGWGGRTRAQGNGLGSSATAGHQSTIAGNVRPEELAAGRVDHALAIVVHCDSGGRVYPASGHGQSCASVGESNRDAPPEGARFWLDLSPSAIAALPLPRWRRAILTAMSRYGMIVGDTGGSIAIERESGRSDTSFGRPDPWVRVAEQLGVPHIADGTRFGFALDDPITQQVLRTHLRVLSPCVSAGRCR